MSARDTVEQLLTLARSRDAESMSALMSEDIVIHCAGTSSLAGDHRGRDGFFGFFGSLQERSNRTFMPSVHEVLGEGDHAVALLRLSAEREGAKAEWDQVNVYHVADGLVTEVWIIPADQRAFDDFWG